MKDVLMGALQEAKVFAEVSSKLRAYAENQKIIRTCLEVEGDKEIFEELLEKEKEFKTVMDRIRNKEKDYNPMSDIAKLDVMKFKLKSDYMHKVIEKKHFKLENDNPRETFNDKMEKVLKQGKELAGDRERKELLEEAVDKSPMAVLMMAIIKKLANEFALGLKENGIRIDVPVDPDTETVDYDDLTLSCEGEGITSISLEEALKTIARFLPLVINAEIQNRLQKKIKKEGESK